jgi:MoxR-like ATPase
MSGINDIASPCEVIQDVVERTSRQIAQSVFGHEQTSRLLIGAFLIGGHVLLEGPPGIAKTLMAKTFARALGLRFQRIQFTPDLMPSDVTGVYVFEQTSAAFRFAPGPVFADIVLADEINRTPPKTQSALLEAMEEHFVTIDGKRHPLGRLFFVMATQNPIEHEGTFPLPEAQLDRFLFKLKMSYPGREYETAMVGRYSSELPPCEDEIRASREDKSPLGVVSEEELDQARALLRRISIDPVLGGYIQELVEASRCHAELLLGASPRAGLHLALAAKLNAALDQRNYVIPDDVKAMVPYVFAHRLVFQPEVYDTEGRAEKLVEEVIARTPAPDLVAG